MERIRVRPIESGYKTFRGTLVRWQIDKLGFRRDTVGTVTVRPASSYRTGFEIVVEAKDKGFGRHTYNVEASTPKKAARQIIKTRYNT